MGRSSGIWTRVQSSCPTAHPANRWEKNEGMIDANVSTSALSHIQCGTGYTCSSSLSLKFFGHIHYNSWELHNSRGKSGVTCSSIRCEPLQGGGVVPMYPL